MEIVITFENKETIKLDPSTVVSYRYSDHFFAVITNGSKSLYLYNMNDISKVEMRVTKNGCTVKDYEEH